MNQNTCRVHNPTTSNKVRMFKYATRHWAHYRCWLQRKLAENPAYKVETFVNVLATLHVHQLHEFPILALQESLQSHGHVTNPIVVLRAALKLAEKRESSKVS